MVSFPASLARRMFVTQGLSASAIAAQLDLPVPLVRQQILDVVLLPPPQAVGLRLFWEGVMKLPLRQAKSRKGGWMI